MKDGSFSPVGSMPSDRGQDDDDKAGDFSEELAKWWSTMSEEQRAEHRSQAYRLEVEGQVEKVRTLFRELDWYPDAPHELDVMTDRKWQHELKWMIGKKIMLDLQAADIWPVMEMIDRLTFNSPSRAKRLAAARKRAVTAKRRRVAK